MGLKTGEFTDKDIKSVDKVITCLKLLNKGRELKLGEYTYRIAETHHGGFNLLFKMGADWFGYGGNIITFSEECNRLTEDEITIFQANNVLNQIK